MSSQNITPYVTIPRFSAIPFLRHGFGTTGLKEKDLRKGREWQDFRPVFLEQTHSDAIHFLDQAPESRPVGDALITRLPGLLLMIRTADCLPALVVDESRRIIAAVHCGWRGTAHLLLERVVEGLKERYQSRTSELLVAFGPCIGPDCYEVGEDVWERLAAKGFPAGIFRAKEGAPGKYFLDLREANRWLLRRQGIPNANIFLVDSCTHCHKDYYSYRRDKNTNARMLSFIGLTGNRP